MQSTSRPLPYIDDLENAALDAAVANLEGLVIDGIRGGQCIVGVTPNRYVWAPTKDWSQAGPIIEREGIVVQQCGDDFRAGTEVWAGVHWDDPVLEFRDEATGPTYLIAAMRCFVASRPKRD